MKNKFLSIRFNAIVHIAGFFLLVGFIVFLVMRLFAFRGAEDLDRNQALLQVQRIRDGFNFTAEAMQQTANDWSKWDETFYYVEGTNPTFIDQNIYVESLQSIHMDMVLIYSLSGELIYQQHFDFENMTSKDIQPSMISEILMIDQLISDDPNHELSGLISFDETLFIFALSPIMRSDYQGEVNGALIFIRQVDDELIESLGHVVGLPFSILPHDDLSVSDPIHMIRLQHNQMMIRGLIFDINDQNNLMVELIVLFESSFIINQAIEMVTRFVVIILVVFLFLMIWTLDRQLFKRIHRITENIKELNHKNDIHLRVNVDRRQDEITYIGNEINNLLDKLELSYEEINVLAFSDYLTNTHNRVSFYRKVEDLLLIENQQLSIFLLDLDGFKEINDTYGHDIGDEVLVEVAKRIKSVIHPSGILSRTGGDEFLICYPSIDLELLSQIATNIIHHIALPIKIETYEISVAVSIGISMHPNDGQTVKILVKKADMAMYQAKNLGKNQFKMYKE